ncbi:glycosyltransferase [Candidatus Bathyarchaeota archaeon]|nr:glycosyltransferase [Candidatus Bathyarchaeota archaeon]
MRILQVIPVFVPAWQAGGPIYVVYNLSRVLVKRGHEVYIYTTNFLDTKRNFSFSKKEYNIEGIHVIYFRNYFRSDGILISPAMPYRFLNEFHQFDVIHIHSYRGFQDIIAYLSKKFSKKYILQAHGSLPRIMAWRSLKRIYDVFFGYRLLRGASKVVALSQVEAEQYRAMGVPEERIAIIPNGIDLSEYADLPPKGCFKRRFGIPEEKKMILYLGRIHKTKGIDFLIKAYAHLTNKMGVKDIVLVIAGTDDGFLNEAKALAESLGVSSSVLFTGFISEEDKLKALVDAEVFVTPSFYGFPIAFLEACAAGTPIITTSLGDTLEWIDSKVGYVTQPTPHDIAEAIYKIVSDKELRKKLSENCENVVKSNFSIENVVSKLEDVYKEVFKTDLLKPR